MNKTEGMECLDIKECAIGLACLNSNETSNGTCQSVPLGTPCLSYDNCESVTQV